MAGNRNYSSVARATTLTGSINGSVTIIAVTETTGFPTAPFTLVIDPARTVEEAVTVTAVVGLNLTVVRGVDGTAASPHDAGATVRHMATARDFREPAEHINETTNIHGVTGGLTGLTAAQAMDNKVYQATSTDHTPLIVQAAAVQTTDLFQAKTNAGTVVTAIKPTGRVTTPGVDGTSTSTFTSSAPTVVPLIAKGAAAQTAKLISARDAADIELMSVGFDGTLQARSTNVSGNLVVSATGTIPDLVTTNSAVLGTAATGTIPATIQTPSGSTAAALAVKTPADLQVAGVRGSTGTYQLFHGGDPANVVPWKMHTGSVACQINANNSSNNVSVDYSSFGFTQTPIIIATVRQFADSDSNRRRVAVSFTNPTTTGVTFRVWTSDPDPADNLTNINYMMIQMTPEASVG